MLVHTNSGAGTTDNKSQRDYYCRCMPRPGRPAPAQVCPGWPEAACTDPTVEKVRLLALAIDHAMEGRSIRFVAGQVGVDYTSLSDLLAGRTWPDSATIARLEVGLDCSLWPPHVGVEG